MPPGIHMRFARRLPLPRMNAVTPELENGGQKAGDARVATRKITQGVPQPGMGGRRYWGTAPLARLHALWNRCGTPLIVSLPATTIAALPAARLHALLRCLPSAPSTLPAHTLPSVPPLSWRCWRLAAAGYAARRLILGITARSLAHLQRVACACRLGSGVSAFGWTASAVPASGVVVGTTRLLRTPHSACA